MRFLSELQNGNSHSTNGTSDVAVSVKTDPRLRDQKLVGFVPLLEITLNEKALKASKLKPGDPVDVGYDSQSRTVLVRRGQSGARHHLNRRSRGKKFFVIFTVKPGLGLPVEAKRHGRVCVADLAYGESEFSFTLPEFKNYKGN